MPQLKETQILSTDTVINDDIIKMNDNTQVLQPKHNLSQITYFATKRAFDVISSALALILLSPIFLIIAIAIKIDSKGPAIFKQERIGKDGKLFNLYKFRTMCIGADKKLFELLENDEDARTEYKINKKLKNDPRVTKIGKFLRKTSIDELPQLLNVFKGEMSLVGPRPYLPREKEDMGEGYEEIIKAKPGITGLWQVSGRSNITFDERVDLEVYYSDNQSVILDIKCLLKTVVSVLKREGAE